MQPLWKTVWSFLKKLKIDLPFYLVIPLLGYPKNSETPIQKNLCAPMFIVVLFTIAKCWKQFKCPSVNEWIKNLWYFYKWNTTQQKKEGIPVFFDSMMELETMMLSEISQ